MPPQDNPCPHGESSSETSLSSLDTLENFRQHMSNAYSNAGKLLRELKDLKEENKRQALELQEKQAYIHQLEKEADGYNSQLFRTLNVFKVSDRWISERLNDIYHVLFNWVTQLPDIAQFPEIWPKAHAFLNAKGYGGSLEMAIDAKNMDHLQYELVTFSIFRILWECFFKSPWAGASVSTQRVLDQLYENINKLDPKIDSQDIEIWRSNTFRALAMSAQYHQHMGITRNQATEEIVNFAKGFQFTEEVDWGNMTCMFRQQVVVLAASLATQLRSSPDKYEWTLYDTAPKEVQKRDLQKYDIIDSSTHCQVSNNKFRGFANSDVVGTFILPMYPATLRQNKEDRNAPHLVKKGWIVVAVKSPKGKSENTRSPVMILPMHHRQKIKKEPSPSPSESILSTTKTTGPTTKTDDDKASVFSICPWRKPSHQPK